MRRLLTALITAGCGIVSAAGHASSPDFGSIPTISGVRSSVEGARPGRSSAPISADDRCVRWRRVASRLGETFAGLRLRRTMVAQSCALSEPASGDDGIWSWPWDHGEVAMELPPRLHGRYGAWSIHCGVVGRRERCALAQGADVNILPGNGAAESAVLMTHFVIDEVGGEQRLLWRVTVERTLPTLFRLELVPPQIVGGPGFVDADIGSAIVRKEFDACGQPGCIMEAEIGVARRIAHRLSEGGSVRLDPHDRARS